jgi:hypothetical protein
MDDAELIVQFLSCSIQVLPASPTSVLEAPGPAHTFLTCVQQGFVSNALHTGGRISLHAGDLLNPAWQLETCTQ